MADFQYPLRNIYFRIVHTNHQLKINAHVYFSEDPHAMEKLSALMTLSRGRTGIGGLASQRAQ